MHAPFPYAGEACALLSSLLWASAFLVFARMGARLPAAAMNLAKNATATLCFAVLFLALYGTPWPGGMGAEALILFAVSGFVGLTLCDTLLFKAMGLIGPQRTTLLLTMAVPLATVAALLPPWNETPPTALGILGIGVCLLGVALAVLERHPDPVAARSLKRGVVLGLLAALGQAAGVLLARLAFRAHGAESVMDAGQGAAIRLLVGSLGLVALALLTRQSRAWHGALTQPGVLKRLMGAAFVGTFLGIWANQAGLTWAEHTGVATTLNQLTPVWLIPLTTIFLGERHTARSWLATALAVGGVILLSLG
jgi:drug/metabolite transporter (DMT)-like permease